MLIPQVIILSYLVLSVDIVIADGNIPLPNVDIELLGHDTIVKL